MTYLSWDMERDRQNLLSFWTILCIFILPNNPKNQHFEKMDPPQRYYHFTHVYHKWQQLYDAWFLKHEAWQQNFLSFWTIFCSFTPLTQKIKILKNWKKLLEISSFTQVYQKSWSYMLYCSLDIPCNKFNYFPFWTIFCPFIPASIWYATSIVRMRICAVAILQYFACENWSQGNWFF